jgi:imidazolonepropionase-like amidohydrolase
MNRRTFLRGAAVLGAGGLAVATAGTGAWAYRAGYLDITLRPPLVEQLSASLPPRAAAVAFTGVTVLPMDRDRRLADHTVVVSDQRITAVGPDGTVAVPDHATVVRGRRRFLVPGLADMHVHVQHPDELLLFVTSGVTTVRNMWGNDGAMRWMGFPDQRELRDRVAVGELLGPQIITAGPVLDGSPPTVPFMRAVGSVGQARDEVAEQAAAGYDFVKVYDRLTPEVFEAIAAAARDHDLPVAGHVPGRVDLRAALSSGLSTIEHLTGYLGPDAAHLLIPEARLAEVAAATAEAGVWNCPTFVIWQQQVAPTPDAPTVPPRIRRVWRTFAPQQRAMITHGGDDYADAMGDIGRAVVGALHGAGAGLLVGTDTDNANVIPGDSVHDEVQWMARSGLRPFDALAAATRDAAASVGRSGMFGTVAPGARADLVLVDGDPLRDLTRLRRPAGVVVAGRWLDRAALDGLLTDLEEWNERG